MIVTYIINVAIRKVRAALRDDPEKPHFVETVVSKGYRLAAPVIYGNGDSRLQVEVPAPSAPAETTVPSAGTKDALIPLRLVLIAAGVIVIVVVAFVTKRGSSKATSQPAIASRLRRNRNSRRSLRRLNAAFAWLDKAYAEHDPELTYLRVPNRRFGPCFTILDIWNCFAASACPDQVAASCSGRNRTILNRPSRRG